MSKATNNKRKILKYSIFATCAFYPAGLIKLRNFLYASMCACLLYMCAGLFATASFYGIFVFCFSLSMFNSNKIHIRLFLQWLWMLYFQECLPLAMRMYCSSDMVLLCWFHFSFVFSFIGSHAYISISYHKNKLRKNRNFFFSSSFKWWKDCLCMIYAPW